MRQIYFGFFNSWKDVQEEYGTTLPEPDVVIAAYDYVDYSGDSMVVYRGGDSYYMVEGSHCSCYGLEGQWDPTNIGKLEMAIEYFQGRDDVSDGKYGTWAGKAVHELTLRACARLI